MSTALALEVLPPSEWQLPAPPLAARHNTQPWRISPLTKTLDHHCVLLGSLGFNYHCISAATGYSVGQISYRLKKYAIKVRDYREGKSPLATLIIRQSGNRASRVVNKLLSEHNHEHL